MSSRNTSSPLSYFQLFWIDSVLNLEASCCSETSYHSSSNYNLNTLMHLRTVLRRMSRANRQEITGGWRKFHNVEVHGSPLPHLVVFCGFIRLMVHVYSVVLEECTASAFRVTIWITLMLKWSEKVQISSSLPIWLTRSVFQPRQHPHYSDPPEDGGRFSSEQKLINWSSTAVKTWKLPWLLLFIYCY